MEKWKINGKEVLCYEIEFAITIVWVFNKCVLYITYAKDWPYYSIKNGQIHIMTLGYY